MGVVVYGTEPQAGMKVTLALDPASPPPMTGVPLFAPALTDAAGAFAFEKVPPGKYVVTAAGLVFNKNRQIASDISVAPPLPLAPLRLKLP
jgi:hypothetical protein